MNFWIIPGCLKQQEPQYRSLMNVPFVAASDELNKEFIKRPTALDLSTLKDTGWLRNAASIYNAMPEEGV